MIGLTARELQAEIKDWRASRSTLSVILVERQNPDPDSSDDYRVTFEAAFKSPDLYRIQLELYATEDNFVGIGIETRERIATRLGVHPGRSGYATGHEPSPMSADQLRVILDAAAEGRMFLLPQLGPLGLRKTTAVITTAHPELLPPFDSSRHWRWLRIAREDEDRPKNALLFDPW